MRNLLIFMLLVALFVVGNRSCNGFHFGIGNGIKGEGNFQTETRSVSGFNGVDLEIPGEVEVTVGEQYAVEISAYPNHLPHIRTELNEDGALHIYSDENLSNMGSLKFRVTTPAVKQLSVGGSGKIRVVNNLNSENISLAIAGSGDIICQQAAFGQVQSSIGGSGTIELGGTAREMKVDISGSGDIKAKSMTINNLEVSISGSGTVTADVSTQLKASISGSGDVYYSGNPSVDSSVSGSGKVKKIEAQ